MLIGLRYLTLTVCLLLVPVRSLAAEDRLPIFDGHIHYSHDVWAVLPAAEAIAILRRAGIRRALVSSANNDGTQMLVAEAPDMIIAELRPYRKRGEIATWFNDPTIPGFLEQQLRRAHYVAIGEFHVYGRQVELPVVQQTIAIAGRHQLLLHAHSDADAIERIFKADTAARVLWAHAGFEPVERVLGLLRQYKTLWCDLAVRNDPAHSGKVVPEWRAAFEEFPDRFLLGTDTYTPERWHYVEPHADWAREWLKDLPDDLAERIAWKNGEALFAPAVVKAQSSPQR